MGCERTSWPQRKQTYELVVLVDEELIDVLVFDVVLRNVN